MTMDNVTIKTNGHKRELVAWNDLPTVELRQGFNYVIPDDGMEGMEESALTPRFFEYRGSWYDVMEFSAEEVAQRASWLAGWNAWQTESYFSAVLIRWAKEWDGITTDYNAVVVGYAHW